MRPETALRFPAIFLLAVLAALRAPAQPVTAAMTGDSLARGTEVLASRPKDSCFLCRSPRFSPGRFWGLTAVTATGYTATVVGLDRIWYAQYPRGRFRFFDDFGEWKDVDKAGHLLTAYLETKYAHELYRWTGMRENRALWAGIAVGTIFQGTLEVLDGFSEQWGASPGDLLFNTAGTALYAGQQALWGEQKMVLKYSWHPVSHDNSPMVSLDDPQAATSLRQRAKDLYGTFFFERMLKDYNGTTCWLSVNVHAFLRPESRFPKWLNFAVGYGAENLYGASGNSWTDADGNRFQADPERFPRYGQWFFSPDIDFSRIPAKKRGWKLLLSALNLLKTPAPALEINGRGRLRFHWLYF